MLILHTLDISFKNLFQNKNSFYTQLTFPHHSNPNNFHFNYTNLIYKCHRIMHYNINNCLFLLEYSRNNLVQLSHHLRILYRHDQMEQLFHIHSFQFRLNNIDHPSNYEHIRVCKRHMRPILATGIGSRLIPRNILRLCRRYLGLSIGNSGFLHRLGNR